MAILIQQLGTGVISSASIADLYTAPTSPAKNAVVKGMRFVNTSASAAQLNVYIQRSSNPDSGNKRFLLPKNLSLPSNALLQDDGEITLNSGDKIRAEGEASRTIEWVLSGIERDAA